MALIWIAIAVIAGAVIGVLADWLLKSRLPEKPGLKHTISGVIAILVLVAVVTVSAENSSSEMKLALLATQTAYATLTAIPLQATNIASKFTMEAQRATIEASSITTRTPPTIIFPTPRPTPKQFKTPDMYGVQLNWTNANNYEEAQAVKQLGFQWAKAQVRWCDFEGSQGIVNFRKMDQLIDAANTQGIKILFSVVCAPNWSRADRGLGGSGPPDDMQKAADFMGQLARNHCNRGLGAIEVWNEQNLLTEWHGKQVSSSLYMDMLKRSYSAIKTACPNIMVVSGAPTPTGVMSDVAVDDVVFLQQMYARGLKEYSDAIGAHPSGFANAPEAAPGTPNETGLYQGHRSFYFRGTMEAYRMVMVQNGDANKRIWPTEFGWASDPNPKPGYEYAKTIADDRQAQWLIKAYQLMKSWGYVGVAFVWNLDFTDMSSEAGAFHILGRAAYASLAAMP